MSPYRPAIRRKTSGNAPPTHPSTAGKYVGSKCIFSLQVRSSETLARLDHPTFVTNEGVRDSTSWQYSRKRVNRAPTNQTGSCSTPTPRLRTSLTSIRARGTTYRSTIFPVVRETNQRHPSACPTFNEGLLQYKRVRHGYEVSPDQQKQHRTCPDHETY